MKKNEKKLISKPKKKFRFSIGLDTELTLILTLVVGLYIGLGLDAELGLELKKVLTYLAGLEKRFRKKKV